MKVRPTVLLGISLFAGLSYMLLPMTSDEWDITFDEAAVAQKEAYLKQIEAAHTGRDRSTKPNIILITADDLGLTDISLYGSPHLTSRHLDRLGAEGVVCTEGYATSPICSPSRAGTLTGRYQQRFGYELQPQSRYPKNRMEYYVFKHFIDTDNWKVNHNVSYPDAEAQKKQGIPPAEYTLAELLDAAGYATAMMGKWHVGHHERLVPTARGFDEMYGFYEAFTLFADTTAPNIVNHQHSDFSNDYIWGKGRQGLWAIRRNEKVIEEDRYLTTGIAEETVRFIEEHQDESFFAYVPFNAPHTPFQATKKYYDQFAHVEDRNKRVYYAMIQALDDAVGRIVQTVDSLGLAENTLICFASDNGGATYTQATTNHPLAGGKMTLFEGGINVPFIMRWPGTLPAGTTYRRPVSLMDFFATGTENAGIPLPEDRVFDGVNLIPYLTDEEAGSPHEALYWRSHTNRAIRKGKWKLIYDEKAGYDLLFDLENDKSETTNLAEQYPQVVKELKAEVKAWEQELDNPRWPNIMNFEIEVNGKLYYFAA